MGYGSGEGPGHGGAMGGPGDSGPSGKGGGDGGSVGSGMESGGEGRLADTGYMKLNVGHKERLPDGQSQYTTSPGMTEAEFNSRLDKYIGDKGLKAPSELQKEGEARGKAAIQNFQTAFNNINAQYQSHLANILGKPGIGTPERAQMEGVSYRQPQNIGVLTDKIRNTVNQTLGGADQSKALSSGKSAGGSNFRSGKRS